MCTLAIKFTPGGTGVRKATLTVSGATGGTALANLSGTGLAGPSLVITPGAKDFASVTIGFDSSATFTVSNPGGVPTGAPAVTLTGTDLAQFSIPAATNGCIAAIPGVGSCTVVVHFTPTTSGLKGATLTVTANPGGSATATLAGTGTTPGALTISPRSQGFGSPLIGASDTEMFTVTNTGGSSTSALATSIAQATTEFNRRRQRHLQRGGRWPRCWACTISACFPPPLAEERHAAGHTRDGQRHVVVAAGASPALLTIAPTPPAFAPTPIGTTATRAFTVTNTGGSRGSTTALATRRWAGRTHRWITGTHVGRWGPRNVHGHRRVHAPTMGGKDASFSVSATPGGSVTAAMTGTGQRQAVLAINTVPPFANTLVGQTSASQTFTVTNNGDVPAGSTTPLAAVLTGTNSGDFQITQNLCIGALGAGATCQIAVAFAPTAGGNRVATLAVSGTPGGTVSGAVVSTLSATVIESTASIQLCGPFLISDGAGAQALRR
jgi:hypothetical protein